MNSGRAHRSLTLARTSTLVLLLTASILTACGTATPASPATPQAPTSAPSAITPTAAAPTSPPTLAPSPTSPAPTVAPTAIASPTGQPATPTVATPFATPTTVTTAGQIGQRTKTAGCVVNGKLPDTACTPGATIATATKDQICQSGYAKNVRNVTTGEKDAVYREYGITSHPAGAYEVDHLISLELGGSNDIANLWPQAANPRPGFHEKDQTENYLHEQVCAGAISLAQAQQQIATNWMAVYQEMPKGNLPTPTPEGTG